MENYSVSGYMKGFWEALRRFPFFNMGTISKVMSACAKKVNTEILFHS